MNEYYVHDCDSVQPPTSLLTRIGSINLPANQSICQSNGEVICRWMSQGIWKSVSGIEVEDSGGSSSRTRVGSGNASTRMEEAEDEAGPREHERRYKGEQEEGIKEENNANLLMNVGNSKEVDDFLPLSSTHSSTYLCLSTNPHISRPIHFLSID